MPPCPAKDVGHGKLESEGQIATADQAHRHLTTFPTVYIMNFVVPFLIRRFRDAIATIAILFVMAVPAPAQWVKLPLPETPRMPDGEPDLTALARRTPDGKPDLSGIWTADTGSYLNNLAGEGVEVPIQPWAAVLYKERLDSFGRDKPQVRCLPHGVPDAMLVPGYPFKIIQTPGVMTVLYEEFNQYRQIFTDGRTLPVDPTPAWFGYAIGRWEGDTFVVETAGFNDQTWLDNGGHPHTDALQVTERYRRRNFGNMELEVTIDDPKAYTKPWKSVTVHFKLLPDTELIEHICENEKDAPHLVGK